MTPITSPLQFETLIKQEKVVIFYHKKGCSNCMKMKPLLAEYEANTPDVKVYDVECEVEENRGKEQWIKRVVSKFAPNAQYPYVVCFSHGKIIVGLNAVFDTSHLNTAFLPIESLKNDIADATVALIDVESEFKKIIKQIEQDKGLKTSVLRRKMKLISEPEDTNDDWDLGVSTMSDEEKKACEACQ